MWFYLIYFHILIFIWRFPSHFKGNGRCMHSISTTLHKIWDRVDCWILHSAEVLLKIPGNRWERRVTGLESRFSSLPFPQSFASWRKNLLAMQPGLSALIGAPSETALQVPQLAQHTTYASRLLGHHGAQCTSKRWVQQQCSDASISVGTCPLLCTATVPLVRNYPSKYEIHGSETSEDTFKQE